MTSLLEHLFPLGRLELLGGHGGGTGPSSFVTLESVRLFTKRFAKCSFRHYPISVLQLFSGGARDSGELSFSPSESCFRVVCRKVANVEHEFGHVRLESLENPENRVRTGVCPTVFLVARARNAAFELVVFLGRLGLRENHSISPVGGFELTLFSISAYVDLVTADDVELVVSRSGTFDGHVGLSGRPVTGPEVHFVRVALPV